MTNEDAIKIFNTVLFFGKCDCPKEDIEECLKMAIKSLSQEPICPSHGIDCEDCPAYEPCENAISRQAVHDAVYRASGLAGAMRAIDNLQSVNPQPKTGQWIEDAETYYKMINEKGQGVDEDTPYFTDDIGCPVCFAMFSVIDNETNRFNYCPNCGAKMVEPQESEEQA